MTSVGAEPGAGGRGGDELVNDLSDVRIFPSVKPLLHMISRYHTAEKPFPSGLLGPSKLELPPPSLPEALPSISQEKEGGGGNVDVNIREECSDSQEGSKVEREVGRGPG